MSNSAFPRKLVTDMMSAVSLRQLKTACPDVVDGCQKPLAKHRRILESDVKKSGPDDCNLIYPLTKEVLTRAASFVEQVRDSTEADPVERVQEVLRRHWRRSSSPQWPSRSGSDQLLFCFTDFEPDDVMAIAQLWEWNTEKKRLRGPPLVVFQANLQEKDHGTVLEKKQLCAQLMLGLPSYYTLAKAGDAPSGHPQHQGLLERREAYLDGICEELRQFEGSLIHLCVMAPGSGNLAAILRRLKERNCWPPRAKWRVSMYSGSFNMRGTTPEDVDALSEIMAESDEPLLDVAKFPFFGGGGCHKWTDSLTTFAVPGFAGDLAGGFPELAAALKLFNDEFNARLIEPKKLIKKDLDPDDAARFAEIRGLFDPSDAGKLREYARALLDDEGLMGKVPGFKKSTLRAFALGGCDSPLCDQLIFLHEWLGDRRPDLIKYEEGYWRYNEEKAFVEIVASPAGLPHPMRVRRPVVACPGNEDHLWEMRLALHDYLLGHLYTLDCHISKDGGRLVYPLQPEAQARLDGLVKQVQAQEDGGNPVDVVRSFATEIQRWPRSDSRQPSDRMMLVYSDMEPDDIMCIAQLWTWKAELHGMASPPTVIMAVDFAKKEGGEILEKKQIMSALIGLPHFHVLTPESDTTGEQVNKNSSTVHPRNAWLRRNREAEIGKICEELVKFEGSVIDLYIIAPGLGNLAGIVGRLKAGGHWPLPSRPAWRVSLYSGQYNMGGMTAGDLEALAEIMRQPAMAGHSSAPLVDLSKFPFFGGKDCHAWTASLTTFASPNLASAIGERAPLLGAALASFNDEFNAGLVNPHLKDFFAKTPLTDEEASRYEGYKAAFVVDKGDTVRTFCRCVVEDADIFKKLPGFKKSTFKAFAYGGCDSPLCDQLIFAYEYLQKTNPDALITDRGRWSFDADKGFSQVLPDEGLFPAIQPRLKEPLDEVALADLRKALESYLLQHLDSI